MTGSFKPGDRVRVVEHGPPNMWWNRHVGVTGTVTGVTWHRSFSRIATGGELHAVVELDTPEPCEHCGGTRPTTRARFVSTWEQKRQRCVFPMLEHFDAEAVAS